MNQSSKVIIGSSQLKAGVARVDITPEQPEEIINDRLFVKALVLESGTTKAAVITVDAVALGEIGSIGNEYLTKVRNEIWNELNIPVSNILISATHVHTGNWEVCSDIKERTVRAVSEAFKSMVPVNIGTGSGYEDRIMENRRLKLKNGKEWTIRHANPLPPDDEVIGTGPTDPEIGILRLDKTNGDVLAIVFNFACHPYQGVPGKTITADFPGFASKVIEDNLSENTIALYIQGCAGDISTILYKDVNNPRNAEPLGNMLGLSTLKALRKINCRDQGDIRIKSESLMLPQRSDFVRRIKSLEEEQEKLIRSLKKTSLNLKMFILLYIKYNLYKDYPSYYSHRYLHEKLIGKNDLESLDIENKKNIEKYLNNIYTMEKLARIQENLDFLRRHHVNCKDRGEDTIKIEIMAIRVGNFILVTFPGELSVQVGLNIKKISPHRYTFVAGYANGYVHYAPTEEQLFGDDYEDANCILAPGWQKIYEKKVLEMLKVL